MGAKRDSLDSTQTAERRKPALRPDVKRLLFPLLGAISVVWFLVRVIPRPSRAMYPCQRAAFPVASAFVLWLMAPLSSALVTMKARARWRQSRRAVAAALFALSALILLAGTSFQSTPVTAAVYAALDALRPPAGPPLTRGPDADSLTVPPAAVVGVIKSQEAQAQDIQFAEISTMVNDAIARAGGLESVITDGDTVILKPNLIAARDFTAAAEPLDPEANGIATDYRVIQATVDAVRAVNPNGAIFLLEGAAVDSAPAAMATVLWDQVTGLDSLIYLEQACGAWFDTTSVLLQGVSLPEGVARYAPAENRYWLNRLYHDADVLISIPVLKNHFNTGSTGAVKNVGIGATPPTIYGFGPGNPTPYERWGKINHGPAFSARNALHNWIHDFYRCRPVDFTVMDGLQGIENGPLCHEALNGSQHISDDQMNARLILAGPDPIAVDAIASLLCGQDPQLVKHLAHLHNGGVGCADPRLIRVDGIRVGDEKQLYETNDSGLRSQYTDFAPPSFAVGSCRVEGDELHLALSVDAEVNKVEVAIDGVFLDQIQLGNYDQFSLDLGGVVVDEGSEIAVYAYDSYLNYSRQTPAIGTAVGDPDLVIEPGLSVWPTPTRSTTTIRFALTRSGPVRLAVYAADGRLVETLVNGERARGTHHAEWSPDRVASGVYFVRLQTRDGISARKVVRIE